MINKLLQDNKVLMIVFVAVVLLVFGAMWNMAYASENSCEPTIEPTIQPTELPSDTPLPTDEPSITPEATPESTSNITPSNETDCSDMTLPAEVLLNDCGVQPTSTESTQPSQKVEGTTSVQKVPVEAQKLETFPTTGFSWF